MPEPVHRFLGQKFHKLRRACLHRGVLFKDPLFPATAQSLFYKREPPPGLTWKRPKEICKDPRLFLDGISTRDLHQGSLGNCWMVAAISCLASEPSLWKKVIPDHAEQEWNPKRPDLYAGIFHFRFWRLGRWTDVVVDDRLPVSGDGVLLFCRSATPREFWSALLEKAYAKLNGCYEALEGGNTTEALIDFTGGVSEPLRLDGGALSARSHQRRALFQTLAKAHEHKALITCSIRPAEGEAAESALGCGLVRGHAYGITALRKVRLEERGSVARLFMVRMRNPWGTADWTGAWSQGSHEWQRMSRSDREKMGLAVRDVGEFWMDFQDFCLYFTDVVVCRLVERFLLRPRSHWREERLHGEWAPAPAPDQTGRCGGCINHRDTFLHNPQFMFELGGSEEEEVLICLQQEDRRIHRKHGGGENLPIGFEVLKVEVNRSSRVQRVEEKAASSVYMDSRSVTLRAALAPGRYVILPTTFLPGATGRFLLRVFCHAPVRLRELREDLPPPWWFRCFLPQPAVVTTVHLRRASGLSSPKRPGSAPGVYAVVRCENHAVRSRVLRAEGNPEFNLRAIFYRRHPDAHISIQLWARGLLRDLLLGGARLQTAQPETRCSRVMDLRGGRSGAGLRGRVYVETSSSVGLTDL
uniref:Si:dkey-19b23.13 n=1 Tax=Tetraodon nigroviridis TaxID=99883 RepID=H3CN15_TETNG